MGRFSPTVLPEEDSTWEDISAAVGTIRQAQRQREISDRLEREEGRQVEQHEWRRAGEERDRLGDEIDLYESGYRAGAPPEESTEIAQAIAAQRGNTTQAQSPGSPQPQMGNATQGMAGPAPAIAPPSRIRQAGMQFYLLPSGQGYIDPSQTPDARKRRESLEDDERDHGQETELKGVDHRNRMTEQDAEYGHRAREGQAGHGYDLELEDRRGANDRRLEGVRGANDRRLKQVESDLEGGDDPTHPKSLDKRHAMVSTQINDQEQALAREGKNIASIQDEGMEADSTAYKAINAELEKLRGNRVTLSSARGGDAGAKARIKRDTEKQSIREKRQRALNMGLDPQKVEQAYARDLSLLEEKYGVPRDWQVPMRRPGGQ